MKMFYVKWIVYYRIMFKNFHLDLLSQYLTSCTLGHVKFCVDFEQEWTMSHLDLLPPQGVW